MIGAIQARLQSLRDMIRRFFARPFVRNVATVASGTALAQVIAMAFAPLITRLYGPEAYGLQGIFFSVVAPLSTIAALGFPNAIVLPKSDQEAKGIVRLSLYIGLGSAALTTAALFLAGDRLLKLLDAEAIAYLIYLVPVAMLASVIRSVQGQSLIRMRAYGLAARSSVVTSVVVNVIKSVMGYLQPSAAALIVTNVVGGLFGSLLTYLERRRNYPALKDDPVEAERAASLMELAKKYADFPFLRTPQNLINSFSQALPVLMLSSQFGSAAAGQYGIAAAVLALPIELIGGAVMSVFYPRINDAFRRQEDSKKLLVSATLGMAAVGALPFLIVCAFGPVLFATVFGSEWERAGSYAQWLALWLFSSFMNRPAVSAMPALKLQGILLTHEIASVALRVASLYAGFFLMNSDIAAVAMFSIVGVLMNIRLIAYVIRACGSTKRD